MDIESVKSLFTMFSGEECADRYMPLILLSIGEVERIVLPETDMTDMRLHFLCAVMANYRLQELKSAQDRSKITYAGKLISGKDSPLEYAHRLLKEYYDMCRGLIYPETFVFSAV